MGRALCLIPLSRSLLEERSYKLPLGKNRLEDFKGEHPSFFSSMPVKVRRSLVPFRFFAKVLHPA